MAEDDSGGRATTATASVLFTDVVGSTELRTQIGDDAADDLIREHDATLAEAVAANRGRVVKSLGDGVMAVFEAAADAVAAAIAAQQAVTRLSLHTGYSVVIRAGVSVGDVAFEPDDVHGTAVHEAARLCEAAQGEQILVADLVRALARGRGGYLFESFGEIELRGIPDPVAASIVNWERPRPDRRDTVPFPPLLVPTTQIYIGRDDLRGRLGGLWSQTAVGRMQTVLLVGEPGIGKTRTAGELAREAADLADAVVLYGRCDDAMRVPYQPFVEALDHQTRHAPDLPLGRLPGELTRLVADLPTRVPDLPAPTSSDARTEEHRLYEAVASWLTDLAVSTPVVLVIDDLHWATRPTLQMLLHAVRHAAAAPDAPKLLVVGTYRDTDIDRTHPLSQLLGDLRRIEGLHRIPVQPLTEEEVIEFIENAAGHALDDDTLAVARRAYAETDGNPFFLAEVLRHLIETEAVRFVDGRWVVVDPNRIDVPESVRDVIGQRLSKLSQIANDLLRTSAVVGREFDLDLVARVSAVDVEDALDALDAAMRARLVVEVHSDRYRFEHALVQMTLYDELSASRRRRLHRRITDELVAQASLNLAAIAHHAVEAGPVGGSLRDAVAHVLAAAEQAVDLRAVAEAAGLFRKALELLDEDEVATTDPLHLRTRLGLGMALRDEGDPAFREVLLAVADDARDAGDEATLVRSALENTRGFTSIIGDLDQPRIAHLETALEVGAGQEPAVRAQLEATLAAELVFDSTAARRRLELADQALARARAVDDPRVLAMVAARTLLVSLAPERWSALVSDAHEAVRAADASGDPNLRVITRVELQFALESTGELEEAGVVNADAATIARDSAGPYAEWMAIACGSQFRLIEGDVAAASAQNDRALEIGEQCGAVDALTWWAGGSVTIGRIRDARIGDPETIEAFAEANPRSPVWRCAAASAAAEAGQLDRARTMLAEHGVTGPESIPRDFFWHVACFHLSIAAAALDDRALATRVRDALAPHEDEFSHLLIMPNVPVRWMLGEMETTLGNHDRAVDHFEAALAEVTKSYPVAVPLTAASLARALERRAAAGDAERAAAARNHARAEAVGHGLQGWVDRLDAQMTGDRV